MTQISNNLRTETLTLVQKPWHQFPLVWMLILIPFSSVIMGIVLITLAIRSNDGLVADDYYQKGKEINQVLDRDQYAKTQGIVADVAMDHHQATLSAQLSSNPASAEERAIAVVMPSKIAVHFYHPTRAGRDRMVVLKRINPSNSSNPEYQGPLPGLDGHRWIIQIETEQWRISQPFELEADNLTAFKVSYRS